ncbi:hypothetical protein CFE70_006921 [Pyrenophora teres f. teres 0-1]|uniref:DUF7143 domain-containing protein n=2 Tax=Pyrenophora teres f. teres TaxID=97479 RepID=E3RJB6_PYRTT|nr:hypothetical protein PTT_08224 [Pyrenophora teres f. teres 0-1]KAE8826580.1 hypothetical protein HRS9122_10082 [Pyrenophora teres f. teres]KAE8828534.1 hypothetical protein HRS9139_07753 [Pyrenophora teres f. teres]KAE8831135.1 hypothetical protein PTNB85_07722 [Pyrenophora teres f. teres]KAE8856865.1 hypothetical protein PTNB29_07932 [Pyrenophora teres f. teres]
MYTKAITTITLLSGLAAAMPQAMPPSMIFARQAAGAACFVIGKETLPAETAAVVDQIKSKVTCSTTVKTVENVPDVTSGSQTFSNIDFTKSGKTPLAFALETFNTAEPLDDSNDVAFQDALNVYLATEAGVRSVGGSLAIKVPKFFIDFQMARIMTARGTPPTDPAKTVEHLKDKVLSNAAGEDKALLDQVSKLATELS